MVFDFQGIPQKKSQLFVEGSCRLYIFFFGVFSDDINGFDVSGVGFLFFFKLKISSPYSGSPSNGKTTL